MLVRIDPKRGTLPYTSLVTCEQGLVEREDIAPCLCGVAFGSDTVLPGETERLTLVVGEENCPDGAWFTMASMLGRLYSTPRYLGLTGPGAD